MSSVATDGVALPPGRLSRRALATTVALASAAAAVILRHHAALPFPAFQGACQRLRASGLPVTANDFFCLPTPTSVRISYDVALLLVGIAVVLPAAILAATGRRWSSLLPLAAAPFLGVPTFGVGWWEAGAHGSSVLVAANVGLVSFPVIAIWWVIPRRPRRAPMEPAAAGAVAMACVVASLAIGAWAQRIAVDHWSAIDVGTTSIRYLVPSAFVMVMFAVLLGTDRRWWPWSIAPVALLLSMAPSVALVRGPEQLIDWSFFGNVLPLAVLGLIWSLWRPGSQRLAMLLRRSAPDESAHSTGSPNGTPWRSSRVTLVANAASIAVLVVSVAMFRGDPLPVQIATSLPTYLGERTQAQDVRTKLDLRTAIAAMDRYAARTGTYRGFDARVGARGEPELVWSDGRVSETGTTVPALTVVIESATERRARVAALSDSGGAFCLERTPDGGLRYGGVTGSGIGGTATFEQAITRCGSTPWSSAAVRRLDTSTMCDGLDRQGGYLICRMVQVLIAQTMARTKPA